MPQSQALEKKTENGKICDFFSFFLWLFFFWKKIGNKDIFFGKFPVVE